METDVVVLGAGPAGLAAARGLSAAGVGVVVLEARARIGGRVLTCEDPGLPVPVELGAEFVHGASETSFALLREAGSVALDIAEHSFVYEQGDLREREGEDPWAIVARVMERARGLSADVAIDEFLRTADERERRATRMTVEGFDAADPARASTRAIAEEWSGDNGQTSRQFRPLGGYARLMRSLYAAADPARVRVLVSTPVRAVRRRPGGVDVEAVTASGAVLTVHARAVIVTLPIGVLQTATPAFDPPLPPAKREALGRLVMGPVVKLVLRFRTAFWEKLRDGRYRDAAFFHRAEARFPSFWALLPMRTPILIAWAGGPKAHALAAADVPGRVAAALEDLRVLFGGEAHPAAELEAAYGHDWQTDPYARGAYSYVTVGGGGAREALAAPVDRVLFFAGEATAAADEAGTVAGALQTGERAAREALQALGA